jgi:hypothetical protein
MDIALVAAVVVLTVAELAAVVLILIFGPHGQTTDLVAILTGIVGPVVTSLVALVMAAHAKAMAEQAHAKVDQQTPVEKA